MRSPTTLYPLVEAWLRAIAVTRHRSVLGALASLVTALLIGQSLRPAAMARALPSPRAIPARQRFKRVARALDRPWLTSAHLTPCLVRAVLALVPPGAVQLILDSVRCGRWEVFVVGVRWHGRVLPVGWAVLPYPWPKKQFTPTVCALLRQVAGSWPADRPAHLVADRAFPSRAVFRTLTACGWGWTVRLNARSELTVAGRPCQAREFVAALPVGRWQTIGAATYGRATPAVRGTLVVGRPLVVLPAHQANPGSLRHRARQAARRTYQLTHKHRRPDAAAQTDAWVILFTTHATAATAQASSRHRWSIERTFRDAQGGWDSQHGWGLEETVAGQRTAARVDAVIGRWAVGALIQTWLGAATLVPTQPARVAATVAGWTTTGRLSVWGRGRFALQEPSGRLTTWITRVLQTGADQIAATPALPARPGQPLSTVCPPSPIPLRAPPLRPAA